MANLKLNTIGSDPEVFVKDKTNDKFYSAIGLIGASKNNPKYIKGIGLQEDNVALEFNIPPAKNYDVFEMHMSRGLDIVRDQLQDWQELDFSPIGEFNSESLCAQGACEAGCDPDKNIYTGLANAVPNLSLFSYRAIGGHIHLGLKNDDGTPLDEDQKSDLIMLLDVYLCIPSLQWENKDESVKRRTLYGKAGSYRDKKYGIEYRSLSASWVGSKDRRKFVYDAVLRCVDLLNRGLVIDDEDALIIPEAIDRFDEKKLFYLVKKYKV